MSHPATEAVHVEDEAGPDGRAGAIRLVTIDRPRALNAIDVATMAELLRVFEACAAAPALRVVIVTGAGERAFVAGADVVALSTMSPEQARAFSELGHRVCHTMEALPVPVIAAVNGVALGGGCELALACDFVYATATARFGFPEARLGAIPGFGGTVRLVERVGLARARELLYTADTIDADEAFRLGLVNRVVESTTLLAEARRTAAAICGRAPLAVASAKQALRDNAAVVATQALEREVDRFADLFSTEDLRLGMRAFLDKAAGSPAWRGR